MIEVAQQCRLTVEEYLAWAVVSGGRHEFWDGELRMLSGGTDVHCEVVMNTGMLLREHLWGTGARVFATGLLVRLEAVNGYFYPDVFVTRDERDRAKHQFKQHPCLVVEVLSEESELLDRTRKFEAYQTLESLEEYVLIDPLRYRVDCFRRVERGRWTMEGCGPGAMVRLQSLGWEGPIDEFYDYEALVM